MAKKPTWKVPFDKNGNMMEWDGYSTEDWRDNYEFEATLVLETYSRGRSAARFVFFDDAGHRYYMFMKDMVAMVQTAPTIAYGHVEGTWTFCKRGSNYGVKFVR